MQAPTELPKGFEHLLEDLYFRLEERDRWADHIIRFLLAANGGGVVVGMGYAGVLAQKGGSAAALAYGLGAFLLGLLAVGVILFASTFAIRKGRHRIRQLMNELLSDSSKTYQYAFLELGKVKPKWDVFIWASLSSFVLFFAGILLSFDSVTGVFGLTGLAIHPDSHISSPGGAKADAKQLPNDHRR